MESARVWPSRIRKSNLVPLNLPKEKENLGNHESGLVHRVDHRGDPPQMGMTAQSGQVENLRGLNGFLQLVSGSPRLTTSSKL